MYKEFGIDQKIEELSTKAEKDVETIFKEIDEVCMKNSLKVLKAFQKYQISENT